MKKSIASLVQVPLRYWTDEAGTGPAQPIVPVDPRYADELTIAVRSDDGDRDPRESVIVGVPQVHFAGTPRALEEMGLYLIALARLESSDSDLHEHFEDVQNDDGGTVHLIVRRLRPET